MASEDVTTVLNEEFHSDFEDSDFEDPETAEESLEEYKKWLANAIRNQMMYVSGETGEPSPETTGMVEEIVRQQVIEMVCSIHRSITII